MLTGALATGAVLLFAAGIGLGVEHWTNSARLGLIVAWVVAALVLVVGLPG